MMYPIPKPCGDTGPKPNIRSDGLPQFEVESSVVLRCAQASVLKNAGAGTPWTFACLYYKINIFENRKSEFLKEKIRILRQDIRSRILPLKTDHSLQREQMPFDEHESHHLKIFMKNSSFFHETFIIFNTNRYLSIPLPVAHCLSIAPCALRAS